MPAARTVAGDGWSDEEWLLEGEMRRDGQSGPEVRHRRRDASGGSDDGDVDGLPNPPWAGMFKISNCSFQSIFYCF